jgi:hypothetical protein
MSMFFRYDGYLSFESEEKAQKYYKILTADANSWFYNAPEDLELTESTIKFKRIGNFNSYSSCERTKDLIEEAASNANKGSVKVDEGDGEDNLWNKELISAASLRKQKQKLLEPPKTYKYSGQLKFADEETAKATCKRLLTDSVNSVFSNFKRECEGDKRKIRFNKKDLIIDAQCTVSGKLFKKTEKLLKEISAQSTGGEIKIEEINARKFVPDTNKITAPANWVNDLSRDVFYRISGSVLYKTSEEAETACRSLLSDKRSAFSITGKSSFPVYVSKENRLVFDDMEGCTRKMLNDTESLIREVIEFARTGKIVFAFSYIETMDTFVAHRISPSKVRKWNNL